ncbi:MAG TPA: uroporphyrinogen-III synthase, partial [Longimicrobium sp.]|nr:uroporphyrinogen-III synthase [Longimicrobium sp.]
TSANGVERFWAALEEAGGDAGSLAGARVCAIGPATAGELARRGVSPEVVPHEFVAEAAVEAIAAAAGDLRGRRVLLPRAAEAREVLPDSLRALGAEVEVVAAYRTVRDGEGAGEVRRALEAGEIDAVTFTASSTVRHFAALVGTGLGRAKTVSIGPITSATLRELGMPVDAEAKEYTIPGVVDALRELYGRGEA